MIYSLSGKIINKEDNFLVIETGGIGFLVFVPRSLLKRASVKKKITLFCFFSSENFELYGFLKKEELLLFELLNTVSGIGPRMALKIINGLGYSQLIESILKEKSEIISKKGGVGIKTAFKIILELKEKIRKNDLKGLKDDFELETEEGELLKEVLKNLGYHKKDINFVLEEVLKKPVKFEEKVKMALKLIGKKYQSLANN